MRLRLIVSFIVLPILYFGAGFFMFFGPETSRPFASAAMLFILLGMMAGELVEWGLRASIRRRIAILGIIFLASVSIMVVIYVTLSRDDPMHFAIDEKVHEGKVMREFTLSAFQPMFELNDTLYGLAVLDGNADIGLLAAQNPRRGTPREQEEIFQSLEGFASLPDGYAVRFVHLIRARIPLIRVSPLPYFFLDFRFNDKTVRIGGSPIHTKEGEAVSAMLATKSITQFRMALAKLAAMIEAKRPTLSETIKRQITGPISLSFPEAIYFSITTATTTGYGDIIPNSPTMRFFVSVQQLFSFGFVAYALAFFWPPLRELLRQRREQADARDGAN